MGSIYKTLKKKLNKAKRWCIFTAAWKVTKHHLPSILAGLAAAATARGLDWVEVYQGQPIALQEHDIVLHTEEALQWLIMLLVGGSAAAGVLLNRLKFKRREKKAEVRKKIAVSMGLPETMAEFLGLARDPDDTWPEG